MCRRGHRHRGTRGSAPRCPPQTAHEFLGPDARGICQRCAAAAGRAHPDRAPPRATGPRRRGLGVPRCHASQSPPATAPGKAPHNRPRYALEGTRTALHTVSTTERPGDTPHASRGGHRQGTGRRSVGHCPRGPRHPCDCLPHACVAKPSRPLAEAPPRGGVTRDGVKRLQQPLVPRARPTPDGRQSGGHQSTEIRRINRRLDWRRLFPCPRATAS
jgi:hypothetical protein